MAPLLSTTLLVAVSRGPWEAGWGFSATGLPEIPPAMRGWALNKSVVGYFVANNTGVGSEAENAAENRLGIVGIGWNLNHLHTSAPGPSGGRLEDYEVEQAIALKKARPGAAVRACVRRPCRFGSGCDRSPGVASVLRSFCAYSGDGSAEHRSSIDLLVGIPRCDE